MSLEFGAWSLERYRKMGISTPTCTPVIDPRLKECWESSRKQGVRGVDANKARRIGVHLLAGM